MLGLIRRDASAHGAQALALNMSLPVAAEIHRGAALEGQRRHVADLLAVEELHSWAQDQNAARVATCEAK